MSRRRARGRWAGAVAAVALAVTAAGCASLPVSGPVREGVGAGADARRDVVVDPVGPLPGAGPRAQVRGFLSAAVGVEDNFDAARSYLTEDTAPTWRPSARLHVVRLAGRDITLSQDGASLEGPPEGPAEGSGEPGGSGGIGDDVADPAGGPVLARVRAESVAVVDAHGVYTAQPAGEVVTEELTLVRERGQWRIGEVPDQVFVVETDFALGWDARSLWFPDPAGGALVPEVRWFADRESLPTEAVTELLRGPSSWLLPAVRRSGARPRLSSASVVVEARTARVDLEKDVLDADLATRGLLVASIEATLRGLPRVGSVIVTAGGGRLSAPTPAALPTSDVPVDPSPVLLRGGQPVRWQEDGSLVPPAGVQTQGRALSEPALALGAEPALAALADGGTTLLRWPAGTETREGEVVASAAAPARLTPPSFDAYGWLWSTPTPSDGTIRAVGPDGRGASVAAPWLDGRTLVSLRPSREGARALVASVGVPARGVRVDIVGLRRDAAGAPQELVGGEGAPSVTLASVEDAVWIGPSTAAVLGVGVARSGTGAPVRQVHTLAGGALEPEGAPGVPSGLGQPEAPTLVALAGGDGESSMLLGTADGRVFQRAGARWVQVTSLDGAVQPAYAG